MTGFDYVLLLVVGVAAIGGFMRGFVEEILSLAAWAASIFAIRFGHTPLTEYLASHMPTETGAGVLAFTILLLLPYFAVRIVAQRMGAASRTSLLGPIDRVLGFGFGAIKGLIIVVFGFSILVLGYDVVWGPEGRPTWISQARTYPFINSASEALVTLIAERRHDAIKADDEEPAEQPSTKSKSRA
jgi:membrane protein required for colicin V production